MNKKQWLLLLTSLFCFIACFVSLQAKAKNVSDETGSITAIYDNPVVKGIKVDSYRVGDVSPSYDFTLSNQFENSNVSLKNLDSDGWKRTAQTLSTYALYHNLQPDQTKITNQNGEAEFTDLTAGIYLIDAKKYTDNHQIIITEPTLVVLPIRSESAEDEYDADIYMKYEHKEEDPGGGGDDDDKDITLKVLKKWEGNDENSYPSSVTVELLADGEVYERVELSADNRWKYTWNDLDKDVEWKLIEVDVPENYTFTVSQEGITFLVTNTYHKPEEPEIPPVDPPTDPSPNPPTGPDTENIDDGNTPTTQIPSTDIPLTGILWWPVPILTVAGMALFFIGWYLYRTENKYEKK